MGRAYRILQFSDVHAGVNDFHWKYLFDKRFFGRLNQFACRTHRENQERIRAFARFQREYRPDFTVCTGDLTSIGSAAEFRNSMELLKEVRDFAAGKFLYVPGNHDAYVKENRPALAEACHELNGGRLELEDFPLVFQDGPVEFVALNPCRPCHVWLSTGELADCVWDKLNYILHNPVCTGRSRLLVAHFPLFGVSGRPLSWRQHLEGAPKLVKKAAEGTFTAILSGHVHRPFVREIVPGGALQLCAGSLTLHGSCITAEIDDDGALQAEIVRLAP